MSKLSPIIFIIVSVGLFFTFIDPTYKEVQTLREEKVKNDERLKDAEILDREFKVLQEKYKQISEAEKDQLKKILPEGVDNVRLILDINNIAERFGIVTKNISVTGGPIGEEKEKTSNTQRSTTEDNNSKYGVVSLGFSVVASYDDFKNFMKDLEESLRVVDITEFSVSAADGNFYNYSVKLNTYWLR